MVDGKFLVAAVRLGNRQRCQFQMHQFVHDRDLHVLQHRRQIPVVTGGIHHPNRCGFFIPIPVDVPESPGPQVFGPREKDMDVPIVERQPVLPVGQNLVYIPVRQRLAIFRSLLLRVGAAGQPGQ